MTTFLALFTSFAYAFIIIMYTIKAVKYLSLPTHMRWDLYPVIHEENFVYGGSAYEHTDWWSKKRQKRYVKGLLFLLKDYLWLGEYLKKQPVYWLFLYPWHVGFILIITFHILCFFGAIALLAGIPISSGSSGILGPFFYYAILISAVVSFITGAFGSLGLIFKRLMDPDLRLYAPPLNYLTYLFTFVVFLSGLYAWYFVDPTFAEYRDFWKGLLTFNYIHVETGTMVHIILFDLFLIYLPFTRSMHYITRFFAFFLIRWDDEPNIRGSALERRLQALFTKKVSWSAPHVHPGKSWGETVKEKP